MPPTSRAATLRDCLMHHCCFPFRPLSCARAGTAPGLEKLAKTSALLRAAGRDGGAVEFVLSCLWSAIVAWLIARALSQRGLLPRLAVAPPPQPAPHVTVIVPARDEAATIASCLRALLVQNYPATCLRILVVDDHSRDDTAAIVAAIAARHPEVVLLAAPPLPPRWTGKSHACWIAARHAPADSEWVCFIDADVRVAPDLIASAVAATRARELDLLSLAPRQELKSAAERLIIPCGLVLLSFVQDLRRAQARRGDAVTATGQFMLIRRDVYDAVGGHAAVCSAICEDLEFARRVKRSGGAVLLMDGGGLLATRMYTGWRTLWPGFAKNLVDTLGGPAATVAIALTAVVLAWAAVAVPLFDIARYATAAAAPPTLIVALSLALLASAAAFALHIAAAIHFRIPFYCGFAFPLAYTIGAAMALDSVRRRWRGRVTWKGRIYS